MTANASPAQFPDSSDAPSREQAVEKVIAGQLRELRGRRGWSLARLADETGLSKGMLSKIENALTAPSLNTLVRLAEALDAPVTAFFRGLVEETDVLLVKAGRGLELSPRSAAGHRYQLLGATRGPHQMMEPMLVTLMERSEVFPLYQHAGTEFLFMISGEMHYGVGGSEYLLEPGDSLQFDGEAPHGPRTLITMPVQFLSVKAYGHGNR
ncbi:MAG: XRE family transcriptional regulator [Actinomycetes bacterium]